MISPYSVMKDIVTFNGFRKASLCDKAKWLFVAFPMIVLFIAVNLIANAWDSLIMKFRTGGK